MSMVVRSNMNAMNANRNLSINNGQVAKSLEKLSSGYAINRAGDDAAGLAISEKMKSQIKGLEQASNNSQDGISLIQTAEGGMNEIHDMLNRMVELATKASSGTVSDEVDREAIQQEVTALTDEIDRIADATNFNGINLLDGSMNNNATVTTEWDSKDMQIIVTDGDGLVDTAKSFQGTDVSGKTGTQVVDGGSVTIGGTTYSNDTGGNKSIADLVASSSGGGSWALTATTSTFTSTGSSLNLQVGDTHATYNKVSVDIQSMKSDSLGIDNISVSTEEDAGFAIDYINNAINKVSTNRANLGALQNRLEYTINNLDNTSENMTSANSTIRDTDMASEMMEYTKMNVLTQSAQSMLAQANQAPQQILSLLG